MMAVSLLINKHPQPHRSSPTSVHKQSTHVSAVLLWLSAICIAYKCMCIAGAGSVMLSHRHR